MYLIQYSRYFYPFSNASHTLLAQSLIHELLPHIILIIPISPDFPSNLSFIVNDWLQSTSVVDLKKAIPLHARKTNIMYVGNFLYLQSKLLMEYIRFWKIAYMIFFRSINETFKLQYA